MNKKRLKTILAFLLVLCMVFSMQANIVSAQESGDDNSDITVQTSDTMSGSCGATENDDVTWKLEQNNDDNGNPTYTLTISGIGAMADYENAPSATVTDAKQGWAQYYDKITCVVVGDGITSIGDAALGGLLNVEEYSFGKDVASIGDWGIKVNSTKKFIVNGDNARLKVVDNVLFSNDGTILYAYPGGADAVDSYTTPLGVKEIREMAFAGCDAKKVIFSDGVEKITTGTFGRATTEEIVIPASVTDTGGANQIQKITLLAETFSSETYNSFSAMTELNLPNATIFPANFFSGKETGKLKKVSMPNVTSIGEKGFYYCSALEEVYMPKVESIGATAFENCKALKNIDFPDTLTEIGKEAFRSTALEKVIFPDSLESIGGNAFANCKNLKIVSYGKNIKQVGINAFLNDNAIKIIDASAITTLKTNDYWDASLAYGYIFGNVDSNSAFSISSNFIAYVDKSSYAKLLKNKFTNYAYYAVTNGGTFPDDTEFTADTLATPTKANYKFLGWYDNEGCTGTAVTTIEKGKIYYANWKAKTESTIYFKDSLTLDKIYDGNAVSLSADDYTVTGDNREVTFSYQVKDGNDWKDIDTAPTNAGTYQVKAMVAENDTYASAETGWKAFTISKADATYTVPTDLTAVVGQTLADVALPEGFSWQDDTTTSVGNAGTRTFKITYTPADTDNYNTVNNIVITLTVNPKMETLNAVPVITAEDKTLTVGDTFNPLDGVTASDKEDGDLTDKITVESNDVDTIAAGTYTVIYKVADSQGASCTKTIYVTVNPKMEVLNAVPVITAEDKTISAGDTFDPLDGVTASDKEDGDITKDIEVISNNVDTSKAGTYEVTYKVTDSQEASVTKTITVTVKEKDTQNPTTDDNKNPTDTDKDPVNTDKTTSDNPKTGDDSNILPYMAAMALTAAIAAAVALTGRRKKHN